MAGYWVDTKTGKVVTKQPEEGVQIVSPDVEPGDADKAAVEAAKTALAEQAEAEPPAKKAAK